MASRYDNLKIALATVLHQGTKHLRFLEVGTYDGVRATSLLKTWLGYGPGYSAEYHGFDMFELLTPDMSKAELSKSKLPPSELSNRSTRPRVKPSAWCRSASGKRWRTRSRRRAPPSRLGRHGPTPSARR